MRVDATMNDKDLDHNDMDKKHEQHDGFNNTDSFLTFSSNKCNFCRWSWSRWVWSARRTTWTGTRGRSTRRPPASSPSSSSARLVSIIILVVLGVTITTMMAMMGMLNQHCWCCLVLGGDRRIGHWQVQLASVLPGWSVINDKNHHEDYAGDQQMILGNQAFFCDDGRKTRPCTWYLVCLKQHSP